MCEKSSLSVCVNVGGTREKVSRDSSDDVVFRFFLKQINVPFECNVNLLIDLREMPQNRPTNY